ncbi:hypothetical protein AWC07_00175 [Mycobacterium gastri]|uniref:Uncharacterized protein n=1 Tax=Mycobacterium gastri TaxID=1777 RepID=A0A1X1VU12_MYCGS|nr:hypothetical protein AWC07_00175 [Mycobacterium gastri]
MTITGAIRTRWGLGVAGTEMLAAPVPASAVRGRRATRGLSCGRRLRLHRGGRGDVEDMHGVFALARGTYG